MSGEIYEWDTWNQGAAGTQQAEVRVAAEHPTIQVGSPHPRFILPEMPIVPRLRNPALTKII